MEYIEIKKVNAAPMTAEEAVKHGYNTNDCSGDGYEVTYEEGYKSWCPANVFEKHNTPITHEGLVNTCKLMVSHNYKERFVAEYYQTKIRYNKLHKMVIKYEAGTLDFEPKCSLELLTQQASYMGQYLKCLELRAEIEDINLEKYEN